MSNAIINMEIYHALTEAVGEDFIGEMIDTFLEEGTQLIDDLGKGFANNNIDLFRRAAHSLKSNAATFGAMEFSDLAKELEELARQGQLEETAEKLKPISSTFSHVEQALKELNNG